MHHNDKIRNYCKYKTNSQLNKLENVALQLTNNIETCHWSKNIAVNLLSIKNLISNLHAKNTANVNILKMHLLLNESSRCFTKKISYQFIQFHWQFRTTDSFFWLGNIFFRNLILCQKRNKNNENRNFMIKNNKKLMKA